MALVPLLKLMYLAEREAMVRSGVPIVFDDIYAMRQGMVMSRTFDLMKRKEGTPTTGEWAQHIAAPSFRGVGVCQGVGENSLDGLRPGDVDVVNCVWTTYGTHERDKLVIEVHHELAEWRVHWNDPKRKSAAVIVPYDELLQTIRGPSGDDFDEAETRKHIAAELFREHALSLGRAAKFAGLTTAKFMADVSERGVPVFTGTPESVREDASAIDAWRQGS